MHAVDRWVRLGRRWGLVELAIVLSMQVLGGEPQAAYLLGVASHRLCGGPGLEPCEIEQEEPCRRRNRRARRAGCPCGWRSSHWSSGVSVTPGAGAVAAEAARSRQSAAPFRWTAWVPSGVMAAWGLVAVGFLVRWRLRGWRHPLGAMWLGLAGAATWSAALTAAQLLPVIEFTQRTGRSLGSTDEIYEITRRAGPAGRAGLAQYSGHAIRTNDYWGDLIRTPGRRPKAWVPTHYLGGLTLALALGSLAIRRGPAWRVWLTVIGSLGLLGSLGWYTSPIWMARALAVSTSSATVRDWLPDLGPLDPVDPQRGSP